MDATLDDHKYLALRLLAPTAGGARAYQRGFPMVCWMGQSGGSCGAPLVLACCLTAAGGWVQVCPRPGGDHVQRGRTRLWGSQ